MKKILLKIIPYLASISAGGIFYFLSDYFDGDLKTLFLSLCASFLSIPLMFLFYEVAKNISQKKLNKEIFDYAKLKVDNEVLSIINILIKIVYPYEYCDFSFSGISNFLSLDKDQIENMLRDFNYIGFQVLKRWDLSEKRFHDILENSFILDKLEDEQIISIIKLLKSLRHLEFIQKEDFVKAIDENVIEEYKIMSGRDFNENNEYPDRLVLLKKINDSKFIVQDFGDFKKYNKDKLLYLFHFNDEIIESYASQIFDVISKINRWVNVSGNEFIIDSKMFKIASKSTYKNQSHGA